MSTTVPIARHITERFCPNTGVPVRLGKVWPPRLMVHGVCAKGTSRVNEAIASVFVTHELRRAVEVVVRPAPAPAHDPNGQPIPGLSVGRTARVVEDPRTWERLPITIQWTPELQTRLFGLPWVRKGLIIELKEGGVTRVFHWYVYLTPDAPQLPRHASLYDDHPHYHWITHEGAPLRLPMVSERWIELPAPMSSPALTPACWVQTRRLAAGDPGPETLELLPVFPLEPAVPVGQEVAGWNGALGGHDRRPMLVPLSVDSREGEGGSWKAQLEYWDTPLELDGAHVQHTQATELEPPTACVWPRVLSIDADVIPLHQFKEPSERGCEVKLNLQIRLPDDAEPIETSGAQILLGSKVIGRWLGGPLELYAGKDFSLPCVVDQDAIAMAGEQRLKLSVVFRGHPSRGICAEEQQFRTQDGPFVQVKRVRHRSERRPWLVIDHGTEGTCAVVAFFDGYAPRVLSVQFAEGPIHPSRVYIAPGQGGAWTLTDQPGEDALYTTGIKLGLRYGDGAHPGCPDHVSAIEVARFYLKRFLLDLKERAAWFPLEDANVLVSFPPRLACLPRFVGSLRETFLDVIPEVLWPSGKRNRIRFREEAFLVAMPSLYKDLQLAKLPPSSSRLYWVMDFGGGTTDICGFLCTADEDGEEHTISNFTYPQRFPHHLSGNDVTAAFYTTLRRHLEHAGVVVGDEATSDRRFAFPDDPFPSTRSTHTALLNQTALRELAALSKCTPVAAQRSLTVRDLAKSLRSTTIVSVDDVTTTLVSLLGIEAGSLGKRTVAQLHEDVLDPSGGSVTAGGAGPRMMSPRATGETTSVPCAFCDEPHVLPVWVFTTSRAFRFRCKACGKAQQVRGQGTNGSSEGTSPTILAWKERDESEGPLLVKQDHQNYNVGNWATLRRWVEERRVGPDDQVSLGGVSWERLRDRPELADLFDDPTSDGDEEPVWEADATELGAPVRTALPWAGEDEGLGAQIDRFMTACAEALQQVVERLPEPPSEVVVLLAGRASLFQPIADGVYQRIGGQVIHLTTDWVRRTYGDTGTIDPGAGLKTLTANGGGLFALNQTAADTSHLLLRFRTDVLDCDTYLDLGTSRPYWFAQHLGLRPGHQTSVIPEGTAVPEDGSEPVPVGQPVLGEVRLQVEGLPQDRAWEPWVTVARGVCQRVEGRRARTTSELALTTEEDAFVLDGLSPEVRVRLENLLPRLELLGEE